MACKSCWEMAWAMGYGLRGVQRSTFNCDHERHIIIQNLSTRDCFGNQFQIWLSVYHNEAGVRAINKCCPIKLTASATISFVQSCPTPCCKNTFFTPSGPTSSASINASLALQGTKISSFPDNTKIFFPKKGFEVGSSDLKSWEAGSDLLTREIKEFGILGAWNGTRLVFARYLISSK